jgi:type II secretory ATPase GspE/PulE/Tfp pilus assembly ATPase PilB-like protein
VIFGFGSNDDYDDEEEELELVTFQGALNGKKPDVKANGRLMEIGLVPAKEIVSDAMLRRAETVRVETKGSAAVVRLYIDGIAYPGGRLPKQEAHAITQMLKLLAGLNVKQRKARQKGGIKAEFQDTPYQVLVETEPTPAGVERLTIRVRNLKQSVETPDELGFSETMKEKLREMAANRSGVILACGVPGSGTTSTRFGIARSVDAYMYSVYTIGDLESREIPYTTEFEVKEGDDLETTIQRVIRIDADVIFADAMSDAETAKIIFAKQKEIAFISEFAARDTAQGLAKLLEWVGDPQIVVDGLHAIVSQKLLRVLCNDCKQAFRPNPKLLKKVGLPPKTKVLYRPGQPDPEDPEDEPCEVCGGLGYFGRAGMFEMLEMTDGMREAILGGADVAAIKSKMREERMPSFQSEGLRLVAEGRTSLDELQRTFKSK